ncbi:MAG: hypothetical protein HFI33_15305, partial [Lachnospiraceae bacterium]|nr:hypothetical protein [Lachnospiraceae bacterium]
MESYTVIEPIFSDMMPITETTDPAHADIINAGPKQLLENTLCNRADIDRLKASTGDGADMAYNEGALYALGDYCIYKNTLYRCIVAITQAEQWNAQHWEKTNITNELLMLQRKEIELVDPMTATVAGFAADAQKTGKAIKDVSANLGSLPTTVNSLSTTVAKKADASTVNT